MEINLLIFLRSIFYFSIFLVGLFVSFYIPGKFLVKKLGTFSSFLELLLSFVIGLVMWGFQAYIFGFLNIRFFTYFYLLFFLYSYVKTSKKEIAFLRSLKKRFSKNWVLGSLIFLGVTLQLIPVATSGIVYPDGMRFYGVNGTDGIMHVAYIAGIEKRMPPIEPGAYPARIANYHYWSDMVIADFIRIWHIPIEDLFFRFFPLAISILTGLGAYFVVREFGVGRSAGIWSVFFVYFAGDSAYLLLLIFRHVLSFATPAIDNGVEQFLNMPNAMAKLVFLTSIIVFTRWIRQKKLRYGLLSILMFASLVGLKIYYGIFVGVGLFFVFLFRFIKVLFRKRKKFALIFRDIFKSHILILGILFVIIGLFIYLPANSNSGGLGFYPLEWGKIFIGPQGLDWGDWWLRMQVYVAHNNYKHIAFYNFLLVVITLICVHGTRFFGILITKTTAKILGFELLLFFIPGIILFNILGMTTLQQSGGLNVFNFFVVSIVVLCILLSLTLSELRLSKIWIRNIFFVLIVILTIPRPVFEVYHYLDKYINPKGEYDLISNNELSALRYIKDHTKKTDIIQSSPKNSFDFRTPYVSAISQRFTFLSGVSLQSTHNQKLGVRVKQLNQIFQADIPVELRKRARSKGINYIYLRKNDKEGLPFNIDKNVLPIFYENHDIFIVKITKD